MKLGEKLTSDGTEVEYNGFGIAFEDIFFIHMADPTEDRVRLALSCWRQGYQAGKATGRSIPQNEFRNLMGINRT